MPPRVAASSSKTRTRSKSPSKQKPRRSRRSITTGGRSRSGSRSHSRTSSPAPPPATPVRAPSRKESSKKKKKSKKAKVATASSSSSSSSPPRSTRRRARSILGNPGVFPDQGNVLQLSNAGFLLQKQRARAIFQPDGELLVDKQGRPILDYIYVQSVSRDDTSRVLVHEETSNLLLQIGSEWVQYVMPSTGPFDLLINLPQTGAVKAANLFDLWGGQKPLSFFQRIGEVRKASKANPLGTLSGAVAQMTVAAADKILASVTPVLVDCDGWAIKVGRGTQIEPDPEHPGFFRPKLGFFNSRTRAKAVASFLPKAIPTPVSRMAPTPFQSPQPVVADSDMPEPSPAQAQQPFAIAEPSSAFVDQTSTGIASSSAPLGTFAQMQPASRFD